MGTPAQRQKQFTRYQTRRAAENVLDYRVKKYNASYPEAALVAKDREAAKKIRTRYHHLMSTFHSDNICWYP